MATKQLQQTKQKQQQKQQNKKPPHKLPKKHLNVLLKETEHVQLNIATGFCITEAAKRLLCYCMCCWSHAGNHIKHMYKHSPCLVNYQSIKTHATLCFCV